MNGANVTRRSGFPQGIRGNAVGVIASALACVLVAGCGALDEPTQASGEAAKIEEAQALVDKGSAPLEFKLPGEAYPVDLSSIQGKQVYLVANALTQPYWQTILVNLEGAADVFDAEIIAGDAGGKASEAARIIQQAIAQDAAAIILGGIPIELVAGPVKEATEAGVKVVGYNQMGLSEADEAAGMSTNIGACSECVGREMANVAVAQRGDDVHAMLVRSPEAGPSENAEAAAFEEELLRLCSGCTVDERTAPLAQWATSLPSIASSIASNREINVVVPVFDAMIALMRPSLKTADRDISIISYNATLPALQLMANQDLVTGNVGAPNSWTGWYLFDAVVRAVSDASAITGPPSENRIFTPDNISSIDLDAPEGAWYAEVDVAAEYTSYWGM